MYPEVDSCREWPGRLVKCFSLACRQRTARDKLASMCYRWKQVLWGLQLNTNRETNKEENERNPRLGAEKG